MPRLTKLFPALLLALTALPAFAQVDPERTVATVNGEAIKGDAYYHRMEFLPGVGKRFGQVFTELPPGLLTLDALITERLLLQMAKEKSVYPSDLEVTKEIESRTKEDPKYLDKWRGSGRTDADLRQSVRVELAQFKLQTFGVTIADQEIDAFYKGAPLRFTTPKSLKLRVIAVVSDDDKAAVDADLKAGKPFADVAKARSQDASAALGGVYATVPVNALAPTMQTAVGTLKKGQVSPWVPTTSGDQKAFVKFLVDDILPEKKQPLDAELRASMRREMMLTRGRVKNDIAKDMVNARKTAKIDIASPEFAAAYKAFIDQYLSLKGALPPVPANGNGG